MLKGTGTLASKSRVTASNSAYRGKKVQRLFSRLALFQRVREKEKTRGRKDGGIGSGKL